MNFRISDGVLRCPPSISIMPSSMAMWPSVSRCLFRSETIDVYAPLRSPLSTYSSARCLHHARCSSRLTVVSINLLVPTFVGIACVAVVRIGTSKAVAVTLHQFFLLFEKELLPVAATLVLHVLDENAVFIAAAHAFVDASDLGQAADNIVLAVVDAHHGAGVDVVADLGRPVHALGNPFLQR